MLKKWQILKEMPEDYKDLFSELNPVILQLLYNRAVSGDNDGIGKFLNPDYSKDSHNPFLFNDMKKAVERIFRAFENGEKITIYGDYDADGVTSVVLLEKVLKKLVSSIKYPAKGTGRQVLSEGKEQEYIDIYIPHRGKEGYGLNNTALAYIKEQGASLVITVDCGISNFDAVEYGNSLGLDIIITDHHQPPEKLPQAYAAINPKVSGENYPFRELAGVGVAFKLAQALLKEVSSIKYKVLSNEKLEFLEKWLLDLVAVGTVADCCRLAGENRVLVKYGLLVLNKTKNKGLQALIEEAQSASIAKGGNVGVRCEDKKYEDKEKLEPGDGHGPRIENFPACRQAGKLDTWNIAFQLGPRINAAGRLDHANTSYKLLSTENETEARNIARVLDETNIKRQELTDNAVSEAFEMIEREQKGNEVFFVYEKHWEPGILGLIAGRVCEYYYKPVFAFTKIGGEIAASGRSIPEFDLMDALREMEKSELRIKNQELKRGAKYLKRYGGHAQACGLSLASDELFESFSKDFLKIARKKLKGIELSPKLDIDAVLELKDASWDLLDEIKRLEPFGEGNPKPLFVFKNLEILEARIIGNGGKHIRLKLASVNNDKEFAEEKGSEANGKKLEIAMPAVRQGNWKLNGSGNKIINAVGFSMNDKERAWGEKLKAGDKIDIAGYLDVNEWNGFKEIQIKAVDIRFVDY